MLKGNLKKKKVNVAHKSVQTNKDEEKPQINSADLMSDGMPQRPSSNNVIVTEYWLV